MKGDISMNKVEVVNNLVTEIAGQTGNEGHNALEAWTNLANGLTGNNEMFTSEEAAMEAVAENLREGD